MTVPIVTAEYPREVWDEQRAALVDAMRRGRRAAWWGGASAAIVAVVGALVLRASWASVVPLGSFVVLAAFASGAVAQRRAERGVGPELARTLARSGHHVTVEQARLLLRLGACWSVDGDCLVADVTRPDRVAVVVAPPGTGCVGAAWTTTGDGGGAGWAGGSGDCGGGAGGGDGGGGC